MVSYDQLPSPTNKSTLTSNEENIPAYFNHFMKAINDQINQICQEFLPPNSLTHTNTTQHLLIQVKVNHHTGSATLERHNMEHLQNAPNSNSTHRLEPDHPQDTQDTKTMI